MNEDLEIIFDMAKESMSNAISHLEKKLINIRLVGRFGVIQITKKTKVDNNKAKKISEKFILYYH